MLSDKKLDQIIHTVDYESAAGVLLLSRRIFALCSCGEYFERSYACLVQRNATIRANRVLAQTRSRPSGSIEHDKYFASLRCDLNTEAWAAAVPVDNVVCRCRQGINGALGQLHSRHTAVLSEVLVLPRPQIGSPERESGCTS